jgi:hypothetical protein
VTDYELDDRNSITEQGWNFSLRHHIQVAFEGQPTFYPVATRPFSLGIKSGWVVNLPITAIQP